MRKRLNVPGGLGIVGTEEYEENKRYQKAKSKDRVAEYLEFLEFSRKNNNVGSKED